MYNNHIVWSYNSIYTPSQLTDLVGGECAGFVEEAVGDFAGHGHAVGLGAEYTCI